jgi:hypothetical protein
LYRLDVRLQEKPVVRGFDGEEDFDVLSEKEIVGLGNCVVYVGNEHTKKKGSQDRFLRHARQSIKRRGENIGDAYLLTIIIISGLQV